MNRFLIFYAAFIMQFVGLLSCSDNNDPIPEPTGNGYCLMFYVSGGDPEHDLSEMFSIRQAVEATAGKQNIAVTVLFKASGKKEGEAHNGVYRYIGENGVLTQDPGFVAGEDFQITDPAYLTDFIRWSAEQCPGNKYLLAFAGHGLSFTPNLDLPPSETRATISDGKEMMSSYKLAQGIREAGVPLEAMLAHSCQQGSVEMLAEWEGLADYLLGSPFSIPDYAYDYATLLTDLHEGHSMEDALVRMAKRAMNIWQVFHDSGNYGLVVEVTRLRELTRLWDVLHETFAAMRGSMNEINFTTDKPAVLGDTYGAGYQRALQAKYEHDKDNFFENVRANNAIDLPDFLRCAYVYSGNMQLAPYVNRLYEVLEDILAIHLQTNGRHDFVYNGCAGPSLEKPEGMKRYQTCRFDRLTGWSDLYEAILNVPIKQAADRVKKNN